MKWLTIAIGILVGIPLAYLAVMYAASELSGEVVVLHRTAEDGSIDRVRVWIVGNRTGTWIEHGSPDAAWIARLAEDPVITVERGGEPRQYHATVDPAAHTLYHRLRAEDYELADQIVAMSQGGTEACDATPVRLDPALD